MIRNLALSLLALSVLCVALLFGLGSGGLGDNENAGIPQAERVPQYVLNTRLSRQRAVAAEESTQILFGDFHVHTTFSYDAFVSSLPVAGGDTGPHTVADACDFARHCSALDFWSVNDHAEQITPRMWRETITAVKQCNALAGSADYPDLVTFLGWEWTQTGASAAEHFGHKNVILKDLDNIPASPIAAPGQGAPLPPLIARGVMALATGDARTRQLNRYLAELDAAEAVKEIAHDPDELFSKLDEIGLEALVIPHGTTWGIDTPPVADWRKQLQSYRDPNRQRLLEVYSGYGNPERWIDDQAWLFAMTDISDDGRPVRFDFGFIASSDNHSARPGAGYKEFSMRRSSYARADQDTPSVFSGDAEILPQARQLAWEDVAEFSLKKPRRFDSSWYSSGLVAVHSESRRREDIWDALQRRQTYGTSGPRILLWFELEDVGANYPMGSRVERSEAPGFSVRAVGSLKQLPGCPDSAIAAAGAERLQALCQNECYNPTDQRRQIERIEIVRIRPQQRPDEAIDPLIENAWLVHECPSNQLACEFSFTDAEYAGAERDTLYYVRAVETASATADSAEPECEFKAQGACVSMRDCGDDTSGPDGCLVPVQHLAWSSPIFVNYPR
jgi:hypothetical protein